MKLFDNLVGDSQQTHRNFQPKRFCRCSVEHQLELGLLVKRDVSWFCAFHDLICHIGKATHDVPKVTAVTQQTADIDEVAKRVDCRQTVFSGEISDELVVCDLLAVVRHHKTVNAVHFHFIEHPLIRWSVELLAKQCSGNPNTKPACGFSERCETLFPKPRCGCRKQHPHIA